jgi:transposase
MLGKYWVQCMATKRLDETRRRRLRAGRMLLAGKTPAQAAHAVGVARQTAYTWKAVLDEGGSTHFAPCPREGARRD